MPQFDVIWYSSEIFWMLLSFFILYMGMAYIIFPLFHDIFFEREILIKNDLTIAEMVNAKADKLVKEYKDHMLNVEQVKADIIAETYQDIQNFANHLEAENDEMFRNQIERVDKKVKELEQSLSSKTEELSQQIVHNFIQKFDNKKANNC